VADNAAFARKFGFDFPLLCDTTRTVGMAYGACEEPTAGTARRISYLVGPDGKVRKVYPKVNAAAHPEEVLKDL
jgi:peroxiredoxin Q/BCP